MVTERFKRQTYIHAPPAKIFAYLNDPRHMLEIWPSMVEETNVEMQPDGRHSFDWVYKMAGMKFHGHCDTTEIEHDHRRVDHNKSGIPSTFRWTFEPRDEGTDVTLEIEYEIPGKLLGRLAAPMVRRLNDRDGNTLVENLKERMEIAEAVA
jgi:uncharacterized protein YndB with AHSA1/START domain